MEVEEIVIEEINIAPKKKRKKPVKSAPKKVVAPTPEQLAMADEYWYRHEQACNSLGVPVGDREQIMAEVLRHGDGLASVDYTSETISEDLGAQRRYEVYSSPAFSGFTEQAAKKEKKQPKRRKIRSVISQARTTGRAE